MMIARTLHVEVAPDRVDEVVAAYRSLVRPIHERAEGLRAHYVLVDRERGWVRIIGVWESPEAIEAAAQSLEPARRELWSAFDRSPELEVLEVADTLLRPPA